MTATKVKVSANGWAIDDQKTKIELSLKLISDLLIHYEEMEIELTDKEMNALIQGNFALSIIDRLAQNRYSTAPRKQRENLIREFVDDVQQHTAIFKTNYLVLSPAIEVRKGKAVIKDGAIEAIEQQYTHYITEPKSIELFQRHTELITALNALKDEINGNTNGNINTSYLVHFDGAGNAYAPNTNYGN